MKSLISVFICSVIIITFTSNAYCESRLSCGKEYRFITNNGIEHQGDLWRNNGDSLTLRGGTTIALSNVESVYLVKRHSSAGAKIGAAVGAVIGSIVADRWQKQPSGKSFGGRLGEGLMIILSGTIIGGFAGVNLPRFSGHIEKIVFNSIRRCVYVEETSSV